MLKYDFVYILKDTEENEELRYSLRSISQNVPDLINRVVFVGGKPKGFKGYYHIPNNQIFNTKWKNAIMGIYAATKTQSITDNFVLMNDDFYIMKPIDRITKYYDGSMEGRIDELPDSRYKTQMKQYFEVLRKYYNLPLNYATHTPMLINKKEAEFILQQLEPEHNFRNLYGNLTQDKDKGQSFRDNKLRKGDKTWNKDSIFASSEDDTFPRMRTYLRNKFKHKCEWEE